MISWSRLLSDLHANIRLLYTATHISYWIDLCAISAPPGLLSRVVRHTRIVGLYGHRDTNPATILWWGDRKGTAIFVRHIYRKAQASN